MMRLNVLEINRIESAQLYNLSFKCCKICKYNLFGVQQGKQHANIRSDSYIFTNLYSKRTKGQLFNFLLATEIL